MHTIQIALDGPSGSGKSTMAKRISRELGFYYIDTGALYRAVGLFIRRRGIDPSDAAAVSAAISDCIVSFDFVGGAQRTMLDGEDVSEEIRRPEISTYSSKVSAVPAVRELLLDVQRDFARGNNVIMDGRDIGTTVLPNAGIKIYLTASDDDRATRRYLELKKRGEDVDYDTVLRDIRERDERDMSREISPLRRADDAILVDTSGCTVDEAYAKLLSIIKSELEKV
jgi:cytidylate kinase